MQHYPFEDKVDSISRKSIPPTTIANVPARIIYAFIATDMKSSEDSAYRLFSIYGPFPADSFSKIRDALIEKYGEPTKREAEVMQNRMGATFQSELMTWAREEDVIRLKQYAGSMESSSLSIMNGKQAGEYIERQKAKQGKQGAKDL